MVIRPEIKMNTDVSTSWDQFWEGLFLSQHDCRNAQTKIHKGVVS